MEVSKINTAYERYRWATKEAERLFDMPLVVQYSGGKDSEGDCVRPLSEALQGVV